MAPTESLPKRVVIKEVINSRYQDGVRPLSWDLRVAGVDTVITTDNHKISLNSDGGQTPPKPGWVLMLTEGDSNQGYKWTLYGLPQGAEL